VCRVGRALHGDEGRALTADGEVVDDLEQWREAAGRGADSDQLVWMLDAHGGVSGANLGPNLGVVSEASACY
jgi:hypothetical protein